MPEIMVETTLQKNLEKEINKWLPKVKQEFQKIKKTEDISFLANINAYIQDAEHFLNKKDLIRAFEAVIWAWAWLEIGKRKKILR